MNEDAALFLEELKQGIACSDIARKINSVILLGSVVGKEWVKGRSDIDTIVIVNDKRDKSIVWHFMNEAFLMLDKKHSLGLKKTLLPEKTGNLISNIIYRIHLFITNPIIVYSIDEVRSNFSGFVDARTWLNRVLFSPINVCLFQMKTTAVTLYGEDHLPTLEVGKTTLFEKIRLLAGKINIALSALIVLPFLPVLAARLLYKISRYEIASFFYCNNVILEDERREVFFRKILPVPFVIDYLNTQAEMRRTDYKNVDRYAVMKLLCQTLKFLYVSQSRLFFSRRWTDKIDV
ncbi:MAG: hypothetical protein JSV88_05325 [Candidatus Aminicenantes bacterium]|nr:MAG: hypothetical protein JSV88_05325 [Candidatus Aminicenantes bacterium]